MQASLLRLAGATVLLAAVARPWQAASIGLHPPLSALPLACRPRSHLRGATARLQRPSSQLPPGGG
eukprot:11996760-Alexandrium_andersonii.AAC.1